MPIGYIKLHRKLLEWEWKTKPLTTALYVHLMLTASFEDNKWRGITIKKGQLVTGRKKLSQNTGLTEQQVRTALNHLKSTNEVTIKSTKEYSIISITNWNKYQSGNQQNPNEQPSTNQPITTTKEGKEGKKVKKIKEGVINIPEFIDGDIWTNWIQHRKEIRKKLTPTQSAAQVKELTKWHTEGLDVNKAIQKSITKGWTGIFKPDGQKPTRHENIKQQTQELIENGW